MAFGGQRSQVDQSTVQIGEVRRGFGNRLLAGSDRFVQIRLGLGPGVALGEPRAERCQIVRNIRVRRIGELHDLALNANQRVQLLRRNVPVDMFGQELGQVVQERQVFGRVAGCIGKGLLVDLDGLVQDPAVMGDLLDVAEPGRQVEPQVWQVGRLRRAVVDGLVKQVHRPLQVCQVGRQDEALVQRAGPGC